MPKKHLVSIIIPSKIINDYIRESVPKILELDWGDFEILIFTDKPDTKHKWPNTKIIASGEVGPAEKRDLALKYGKGEIFAFLDDDAYPRRDWLKKAIPCFLEDKQVGAVGGPAITPKDDGLLQKVSGAVFESIIGGSGARGRYLSIGKPKEVEDWPTVNLLVRRDIFEKIGGFDNKYWPGEDTKLCLDILNKGYKIMYEPEAIVYHHRRSDLYKHLKQAGNYALHRGYFAKIYPKTSRKIFYFVPSFFDLYLLGLVVFLGVRGNTDIRNILLIPLAIYFLLLIIDGLSISWRWKSLFVGMLTIFMIFFTHVWYGIRFIWGLLVPKLER